MLVIVPSRGRPQNIARLIDAWQWTKSKATLLVVIDNDDPKLNDYMSLPFIGAQYQLEIGNRARLGPTLNRVAMPRVARPGTIGRDIIGFMGDDHVPRTDYWDEFIDQTFALKGAGVVYGNDLLQGSNLPTAVFMSASIIRTLGYMCPPGMTHMFLDNVWKLWGEQMKRLTYLADVIIEHIHPVAGKAEWDVHYAETNSGMQYDADRRAYDEYVNTRLAYDVSRLRELTSDD